jgi:hypothetical protein
VQHSQPCQILYRNLVSADRTGWRERRQNRENMLPQILRINLSLPPKYRHPNG